MKKSSGFLTGLAAGLLSIGLALAGCESPTAGSNGAPGGPGGPGRAGPITQDLSAAQLQTILDAGWNPVYVVGDVEVSGPGTVTIPAEKTLSVLEGTLTLNGGVVLNAVADDALDLEHAAAVGLAGTAAEDVVILPANYAYAGKLATSNLTVAPLVTSPNFDTDSANAIDEYTLPPTTSDIPSQKTLYVLKALTVTGTSVVPTGKVVALGTVTATGTNATALADSTKADITAATLTNTAAAAVTVTLPGSSKIAAVTPGTEVLTIALQASGTFEIGTLNGPNTLTAGAYLTTSLTIGEAADGAKLGAIPVALLKLIVNKGNLDVAGSTGLASTFNITGTAGTVTLSGALVGYASNTGVLTVGTGTFTDSTAANTYPIGTVFNPADNSVTLGGALALTTGNLEVAKGAKLLTGTGKITVTSSGSVIEIGSGATLVGGTVASDKVELKASDGTVVLTWNTTSPSISGGTITATKTGGGDVLTLTGATITAGTNGTSLATITAATPSLNLAAQGGNNGATLSFEEGGTIVTKGAGTVTLNATKQTFGGGAQDSTFTVTGAITIAPTDTAKTGITGESTADILSLGTGAVLALAATNTLSVTAATLDVGEGSITLAADSSILKLEAGTTSTAVDIAVLKVASGKTIGSGYASDTDNDGAIGAGFIAVSSDEKTNITIASGGFVKETATPGNDATKLYSADDVTGSGNKSNAVIITVTDSAVSLTPTQSTSTIASTSLLQVGGA